MRLQEVVEVLGVQWEEVEELHRTCLQYWRQQEGRRGVRKEQGKGETPEATMDTRRKVRKQVKDQVGT